MAESNTKKLQKLAEELVNLNLKEVKILVDILREEHGIEPAAATVTAVAAATTESEEEKAEQTIFDVVLDSAGTAKLGVIKIVKSLLQIGLKEAKDLVESAPGVIIKEALPKEEAEKIKQDLEKAGAKVVLK